jgi:hypothetical protein
MHIIPGLTTKTGETCLASVEIPCLCFTKGFITVFTETIYNKGQHISQHLKSHLKILGARMVKRKKFPTEGPQTLRSTIQNLVTWATKLCDVCTPAVQHIMLPSHGPCQTPKPQGHSLSAISDHLLNTVDPRVTTGLTYEQLGLRPKF